MADVKFPYEISDHARMTIMERGVDLEWIVRVVQRPLKTHPDPRNPTAIHALGKIPEYGDRVLRVIYNPNVSPSRIITAFFDRRMKGRL